MLVIVHALALSAPPLQRSVGAPSSDDRFSSRVEGLQRWPDREAGSKQERLDRMAQAAKFGLVALVAATLGIFMLISHNYNGNRKEMLDDIQSAAQRMGIWAMPAFVVVHALAIALCFPYAILFEAAASFLFGFVHGVACVFTAKVLGAALAFGLGRLLFRSSESISNFIRKNRYFSVISNGVARDGWKFVLLARFSPVPSYVINYALAATEVSFFVDFLLPTLVGGLPMILQNTSIGSLTSAAAHAGAGDQKSGALSYLLPLVGISSGILITWRIRKYAQGVGSQQQGTKPESAQAPTTTAEAEVITNTSAAPRRVTHRNTATNCSTS